MPRIPVIEQTTSVSPSQPSVRAQAQQEVNPFGNSLQIASQGLQEMAHAGLLEEDALARKDNADAIANTGKQLSDADVYWKQYLTDGAQTTSDGGLVKNEDGTTTGFRAKTEKDFDQWSSTFLGGIQNEKARRYAQEHVNALRTRTLDGALTFEASAGLANRDNKVNEAVGTWAKSVAQDDRDIDQKILAAKTLIANSGYDEKTRNEKARQAINLLVESAIQGNIERNPQMTRSALIQRYGIDPTAPAPKAQQPDAQVIPGGGSAFDRAVGFTLQAEGGLNPADTNGTPSNFGINQKAHPGVDVTNLTKAQAAGIYKTDYWDKIGGDALAAKNPALATVAFDTAVIAGVGKAKDLLAKAGDDPQKLMELRQQFLAGLIKSNPEKYGKYQAAWANRNSELMAVASGSGAGRGSVNPDTVTPASLPDDLPPPPAITPSMQKLVEQLPVEKLPSYISAATTQVNQQQAAVRSQLQTTEGDHITAFMNGEAVAKPLTQDDYVRAYGQADGASRFQNYVAVQQLGSDIATLKAMPPAQMQNLAEKYRPTDPGAPGYELATKRYDTLLKAMDQVNKARQDDPMGYALQAGIGGAKPLNLQDQKAFAAEMARRSGVASTLQQTYGTPYAMLSKAEALTLQRGFDGMTTQQKLGYLNTIKTSVSDPAAYRAVMQQIAPDSPVTAMAGIILSKQAPSVISHWISSDEVYNQQDVAGLMLEGEALLNPSKAAKAGDGKGREFPMPKDMDIRTEFLNQTGKAFAGDPVGADFAYQAVKAYYAGSSARSGNYDPTKVDTGLLKKAINAVTGGISDPTGKGEVVRPWGMGESEFKDAVQKSFSLAMANNGYTGSNADSLRLYGLQSAGDGKYLLRSGNGYLLGQDDRPVILNLNTAGVGPGRGHINPGDGLPAAIPASKPGYTEMPPPGTVVQPTTAKPNMQQPKTK